MRSQEVIGTLIFVLSSLLLPAQELPVVTCRAQNQPLESVLRLLEKDQNLSFTYDPALIQGMVVRDLQLKEASLEKALTTLLSPHQLDFEIVNRSFILIKRRTTPTLFQLCGSVKDAQTKSPLGYANVFFKGHSTTGVYTNEAGEFSLEGPFSRNDSLRISYVGYTSRAFEVQELLDQNCPEILLVPEEITLGNVIIKDRAIELLRSSESGSGIAFKPDKMNMLPGWGDNDVLRMLQLLPGVHATDESASGIHIRGGTPDQNLVLWDGIPIYHIGHFFGMFAAFNPVAVNTVDIYRGGFGARFGGRVSGVVDISAKPANFDSLEIGAGANLISSHTYAKIPLLNKRSALLIALRRSYTDIIQSPTYQNLFDQVAGNGKIKENEETAKEEAIDLLLDPQFYFTDLNLKWAVKTGSGGLGSISFYYGDDELDYTARFDQPNVAFYFNSNDNISIKNVGISLNWEQAWSARFKTTGNFTASDFQNDYRFLASFNREQDYQFWFQQSNRMQDEGLNIENQWRMHPNHTLNFGVQSVRHQVSFSWQYESTEEGALTTDEETLRSEIQTLFLDYDFQLPERLAIDLGLRATHFSDDSSNYLEPRLTVDYRPFGKSLHLKAAAGRYVQFVSQIVENNDLGLGEQFWIMANQKHHIPVMRANQWSVGTWWEQNGWLIDLEYYQKHIKDITTLNLQFDEGSEIPFNRGNSDVKGLDLLIKKKWQHYSTWFSYTLGEVRYTFPQINNSRPFPAAHDQLHTINWTHILDFKKWGCSFNWTYGSGRPYTSIRGVEARLNPENNDFYYLTISADENQKRLPPYHRLDASIHYKFSGPDRLKGMAGLSVFNLYDRRNLFDKDYYAFQREDGQLEPQVLQIDEQLLGITPNIFFNIDF